MGKELKYSIEKESPDNAEEKLAGYNSSKDFTTLDAWNKARSLKLFFYHEVVPLLPTDENYNLNIQIRKASISITANTSEGYGRYHFQEGIQFYRIARGSLCELKDHLISCYDLKFVKQELFEKGINLIENTKVTLNGFINFVKKQKDTLQ